MASLKLIAASPDVSEILAGTLAEHGVGYRMQGKMITIEDENGAVGEDFDTPGHVVAMLRDALSLPQRDAISIVEEFDFPNEFPVTTRLEAWWSVFDTSWFEKAIAADAFSTWFQPIVDTTARRMIGYECLLRLTKGRRREGAEIMAAAAIRKELPQFDSWTRQLAVRTAAWQQNPVARSSKLAGSMYFVNFIPSAMPDPATGMKEMLTVLKDSGMSPGSIVMEAVESTRNPDLGRLRRIADYLREQGLGFGLDDVGTNAEAIRLVCDLRPDYIKLDRRLVQRMHLSRDAAAVSRLAEIAERLGARVIAKGVERVSTMEHFFEAGVQCMQGYLFGSPSPEIGGSSTLDLAHLARAIEPLADAAGYSAESHELAFI